MAMQYTDSSFEHTTRVIGQGIDSRVGSAALGNFFSRAKAALVRFGKAWMAAREAQALAAISFQVDHRMIAEWRAAGERAASQIEASKQK
ncbi:MAG: hypothetical protein R3E48_20565 [Burkholderiaceae bacterium]